MNVCSKRRARVYAGVHAKIAGTSSAIHTLLKELNTKVTRIEQQQGVLQRSLEQLKTMQREQEIQTYSVKGTPY